MDRKYFVLFISCIAFFCCIVSCKKNVVIPDPNCPLDSAHLLGKYKISKIKVLLTSSIEKDVTENFEGCVLDDTMQLLPATVYHNIDIGTAITCDNDYYGSWTFNDSIISLDHVQYPIVGFNCEEIVLRKDSSGYTFKFYYDRF